MNVGFPECPAAPPHIVIATAFMTPVFCFSLHRVFVIVRTWENIGCEPSTTANSPPFLMNVAFTISVFFRLRSRGPSCCAACRFGSAPSLPGWLNAFGGLGSGLCNTPGISDHQPFSCFIIQWSKKGMHCDEASSHATETETNLWWFLHFLALQHEPQTLPLVSSLCLSIRTRRAVLVRHLLWYKIHLPACADLRYSDFVRGHSTVFLCRVLMFSL